MRFQILSALSLALAITACGGGGGSSPSPAPPIQTVAPRAVAQLNVGSPSIVTPAGFTRKVADATPTPNPVLNGSTIPKFVTFGVPDIYVQGTPPLGQGNADVYAFLDTSNGSVLPTTLPDVLWIHTGEVLQFTPETSTLLRSEFSMPDGTLPQALHVFAPTQPGQAIYTATASLASGSQSAPVVIDSYNELEISDNPANANNAPTGVSFDIAGNGQAQNDPTLADISISASGGISFPGGGVLLQALTPNGDAINTTCASAWTNAVTSIAVDATSFTARVVSQKTLLVFKLRDGRVGATNLQSAGLDGTGTQITTIFAKYKIADVAGHCAF